MTYESTGEVRMPKVGEYFLMFPPEAGFERKVHPALREGEWAGKESPRVIMRPVVEEEPTVGWVNLYRTCRGVLTVGNGVFFDLQSAQRAISWQKPTGSEYVKSFLLEDEQ